MEIIKRLGAIVLVSLLVAACGVDNSGPREAGAADFDAAQAPVPKQARRIAIVHSQASKNNFYDPFAYNQLFAAVQNQSMMAGIPFDLLDETELASTANLLSYEAVVLPSISHVEVANREAIIQRLLEAQENGVAIMASGEFLTSKPDGTVFNQSWGRAMTEVLGVIPNQYLDGVSASVQVANTTHPVNKTYQVNEELTAYNQLWFASFVPAENEQSTPLTVVKAEGATYNGAQIIERTGRVVHFANDQVMADNNQLWRVMQWLVYGDIAPLTLQVPRSDQIFIARNDMDQAMIASQLDETEIPLLDMIRDWKRDYNFVGSYYIDVGNDPANGEYTDWGISAPLYLDYIALGNEIGTHSWTHPHYTSQLNATELEFEFKDSAAEIGNQIGVPVVGAAVPGNPESLFVVETLNPWLEYLSGRTGEVGSGYPGAFGYLEPQHSMMYFSLNMSPDFTLIDYLNRTPAQATAIWQDEFDGLLKHAQQPLIHWLWHDYGPTTQTTAGLYTKEMFVDTIAYAHTHNSEFVTVKDIHSRIKTFSGAEFSVGSGNVVDATVTADAVGQFALKVAEGSKIKSVENWYAYDDDQVFLAEGGGDYKISIGSVADAVTRISELPMRAKLLSLSGDGNNLSFTIEGEGEVRVILSPGMLQNNSVSGASSFVEQDGTLVLQFDQFGTHGVNINSVNPINQAPEAIGGSVTTETALAVPLVLAATDVDGDALSFQIVAQPTNGTLSGTAPNLFYTSNPAFSGTDTFTYLVSDGSLQSDPASFSVVVTPAVVPNTAPLVNDLVLETLTGQPLAFQLSGSDNENQALSFSVTRSPANGSISGAAPNLIYTPDAGFTGRDSINFVANDSLADSDTGKVVFNVNAATVQTTGTISNTSGALNVDGNLNEWSALTAFDADPQDISGVNNDIDWRQAWMAHDSSSFYLAYRQYGSAQLSWGDQIFLDTDTDTTTGFKGFQLEFAVGAEYMIEGDVLFQYTGSAQNQWAWNYIGSIESAANGDAVELKLERTLIGSPDNIFLFFYGNSFATSGTSIDLYPDSATDSDALIRTRRFSYSVNPNGLSDNVVPVALSQQINLTSNTSYPLTLSGYDQDGDTLTYVVDQQPQSGTLTGTAPDLVYTPNINALSDEIKFRVGDGNTYSNIATIQFNILPTPAINNRPSVNNQTIEVLTSGSVAITLSGNDADGDLLTYRVVSAPVSGSLTGSSPNLVYTAGESVGTDGFTYVANDGVNDSTVATVAINISAQAVTNAAPQAENQSVSTAFETATNVTLSGTDADGDALSYIIVSQPALGSLSGAPPQLTYVPFNGVSGSDAFTFRVFDGTDQSAVATVEMEVLPEVPVNQAPVANSQTLSTPFNQSLNITLAGRDPEQSALTFAVVTQPSGGSLSGVAPDLVYTPAGNFSGTDTFTFSSNDGQLDSNVATVTIEVQVQESGIVSNPVSALLVDGSLSDWSGLQRLADDPADIYGVNDPLDWKAAWIAHSASDLYIAYQNHEPFSLSWGHGIYIDVDGDVNTGFRGFSGEFPIGADYLIETDDLQQYTGTGNNWSWNTTNSVTVTQTGAIAEMSVPISALGNPSLLQFYLRADNGAFGGLTVDHFPDAAIDAAVPVEERSLPYRLAP